MTETHTATLDRIVDGETGVLLLEADGETVDQLTIDVTRLPADGRHEGAVFAVTLEGDELSDIEYRPEETDSRRKRLQERLDRLSSRLSDRD
ncbi:DUF3006 domain-containing protein [Halobiforma lacisalsi AJ5]|uniref:DUF3006 domain-containing protein n=1 Tax=Natronobacterium lacisalsi AJ5 TaxID=358396 RepID=M0LC37_NATLA|nr:DUF3006 domain-containing protein [Halobiforma lacisalsi]APW98445.1 DUF3006 domain-containing protein [Halobiforma lacisalsi AJ5]EMA31132.1 hypothetical protein C445_15251 [Halobiforma lacisalsi AJ5]